MKNEKWNMLVTMLFILNFGAYVILNLWWGLEILCYGEPRSDAVDTVIFIIICALLTALGYYYSKYKSLRDVKPDTASEIKFGAKEGVIRASLVMDDEYPGIALVYSANGNGEPGVVLEHDKVKDQVQLRVWDMDTVDQDPKYVIRIG